MSSYLWGALQVILIIASPFFYLALGSAALTQLSALFRRATATGDEPYSFPLSFQMATGLLIYLALTFFLWHFGLPLSFAGSIPLLLACLSKSSLKKAFTILDLPRHPNFILWFCVVLGIGLTLFRATSGIQTPWVNNYGDLAFHLGQISSFVFGENSTPEYHIFAGERLSYPFLVNLWSAVLWWPNPSFQSLVWVFLFQWCFCWCLVYCFLNGNRYWLLPWAVLFGGGLYSHLGEIGSGPLIAKNIPWLPFISTIWVTQRSAMMGTALMAGAVGLFHRLQFSASSSSYPYFVLALFTAFLPLVHAHLFLAFVAYAGTILLVFPAAAVVEKGRSFKTDPLYWFVLGLLPAVVWLPWLTGKNSMVKLVWGWVTGVPPVNSSPIVRYLHQMFSEVAPGGERLGYALNTWTGLSTAGAWLLFIVVFWVATKKHRHCMVLLALWCVGQFVQLAEWDWDQIKFFLAIYVISLSAWAWSEERWLRPLHLLALYLIFPALIEVLTVWGAPAALLPAKYLPSYFKNTTSGQMYEVYGRDDLVRAAAVRLATAPDDVLVSAPNHNSPVTLSGRRLFYGYEGTLSSHQLPYRPRQQLMQSLDKLAQCRQTRAVRPGVCPRYLLWTAAEQQYFKRTTPGADFKPTHLPYLFEFR